MSRRIRIVQKKCTATTVFEGHEGHGSIAGRFGVKLLPSELTDEPNLNSYGFKLA